MGCFMDEKIIKTGGFCVDGCQWNLCSFYNGDEYIFVKLGDANMKTRNQNPVQTCRMFGNARLYGPESLHICNKVYGLSYEGKP